MLDYNVPETESRVGFKKNLRHSTFMRKIPRVLGESVAHNFVGYYTALNGKRNPCYYLPPREAHLMVMSESSEVQAAVYDRMVELGMALQAVQPKELTIEEMAAKVIQARDKTIVRLEHPLEDIVSINCRTTPVKLMSDNK